MFIEAVTAFAPETFVAFIRLQYSNDYYVISPMTGGSFIGTSTHASYPVALYKLPHLSKTWTYDAPLVSQLLSSVKRNGMNLNLGNGKVVKIQQTEHEYILPSINYILSNTIIDDVMEVH